jgi:hypothetical protein
MFCNLARVSTGRPKLTRDMTGEYDTEHKTIFLVGMIGKAMITARRICICDAIGTGLRYRSLLGPCWLRKSVPLHSHEHASLRRFDRLPDDPLVVSLPRQCSTE